MEENIKDHLAKMSDFYEFINSKNTFGRNQLKDELEKYGFKYTCLYNRLMEKTNWGKNQIKEIWLECFIDKYQKIDWDKYIN
jgi:hypothetical protein